MHFFMALTASAPTNVEEAIVNSFYVVDPVYVRCDLDRPNIYMAANSIQFRNEVKVMEEEFVMEMQTKKAEMMREIEEMMKDLESKMMEEANNVLSMYRERLRAEVESDIDKLSKAISCSYHGSCSPHCQLVRGYCESSVCG